MKCNTAFICARSIIDSTNRMMSVIDIFDTINITYEKPSKPTIKINFAIVTFWERDDENKPEEGKFRITFVNPKNEKSVLPTEAIVNLSTTRTSRNFINITGFTFDNTGDHFFKVQKHTSSNNSTWKTVKNLRLTVIATSKTEAIQ